MNSDWKFIFGKFYLVQWRLLQRAFSWSTSRSWRTWRSARTRTRRSALVWPMWLTSASGKARIGISQCLMKLMTCCQLQIVKEVAYSMMRITQLFSLEFRPNLPLQTWYQFHLIHRCILFKFAELIPSLRLNYFHSFMKLCMNFYMNIFSALPFDSKFHDFSKLDSGF